MYLKKGSKYVRPSDPESDGRIGTNTSQIKNCVGVFWQKFRLFTIIVVDFTEKIKVPKKILPRPTERCHAKVG